MKKLIWLFIPLFVAFNLCACCKCMNCPGSGAITGTGTDTICQADYEATPQSMSWAQYSDYMLQTGCKCVQ
jgi:hypothetical protein